MRVEQLQDKVYKVDDLVRFVCALRSGENVEFTWTKNSKVIQTDTRIQIKSLDDVSSLTIRKSLQSDSGEYSCIAKNEISEDRATASLKIQGST